MRLVERFSNGDILFEALIRERYGRKETILPVQYDASNYLMPRVPLLCNGRFECYKNSRLGLETLAIRELSRSILNLKRLERHRSKSNVSPAGGASQVPEER